MCIYLEFIRLKNTFLRHFEILLVVMIPANVDQN